MRNLFAASLCITAAALGCSAGSDSPLSEQIGALSVPALGAYCGQTFGCQIGEVCNIPACLSPPCSRLGICELQTVYDDRPIIPIPDNDANGITRDIRVEAHGRSIASVSIRTSLTHTYRGDLKVVLTSPSGTTKVLQNRNGMSSKKFVLSFPDDTTFAGEYATGPWTLWVSDLLAADTGTLNEWRLVFAFSNEQACVLGQARSDGCNTCTCSDGTWDCTHFACSVTSSGDRTSCE